MSSRAPAATDAFTCSSSSSRIAAVASGPSSVCLVHRIADFDCARHAGDESLQKLIVDLLVDDESLRRNARLAVVDHPRRHAVATAASRSALGITMNGSLPPSSSTDFLRFLPAALATDRPAPSLPVSVTAAIAMVGDDALRPRPSR